MAGSQAKTPGRVCPRLFPVARAAEVPQALDLPVKVRQPADPGGEEGLPLILQQAQAAVHGGHQQIGGGAGLEDPRLPGHLGQGHQPAAGMEDGGLGEAGQGLVEAGHRQVRPLGHGVGGEGGVEAQVGPVGLVHQHRDPLGVGRLADPRRVADHPVVGGAGVDHQLHPGVVLQGLGHLRRGQGAGDAQPLHHRGQEEDGLQPADLDGVVDGLVAVPGHQDLVPPGGWPPGWPPAAPRWSR